jgi:hypothetical protein
MNKNNNNPFQCRNKRAPHINVTTFNQAHTCTHNLNNAKIPFHVSAPLYNFHRSENLKSSSALFACFRKLILHLAPF